MVTVCRSYQARLDARDTDVKRLRVELEAAQEREQSKLAELLEAGEAAELLSTELERCVKCPCDRKTGGVAGFAHSHHCKGMCTPSG